VRVAASITILNLTISAMAITSVPPLATVRWRGRLRFKRALAAEGLSFGSKVSLFSIATMASARLDLRQRSVAWGREFLRTLQVLWRRERSR
jgi:hypothetical protein